MGRPNLSKVSCYSFGIKVNSPYLYKVLHNITNEAIIFNRTRRSMEKVSTARFPAQTQENNA